jgi:hypothetical protein
VVISTIPLERFETLSSTTSCSSSPCRDGGTRWRRPGDHQGCEVRSVPREHIKDSERQQGATLKRAEEIAARTVNKQRARSGESKTSSRTSTSDLSSGRRGGLRSGKPGPRGRTREQLYQEARRLGVKGCTCMTKAQLNRAIKNKERRLVRVVRRRQAACREPGHAHAGARVVCVANPAALSIEPAKNSRWPPGLPDHVPVLPQRGAGGWDGRAPTSYSKGQAGKRGLAAPRTG